MSVHSWMCIYDEEQDYVYLEQAAVQHKDHECASSLCWKQCNVCPLMHDVRRQTVSDAGGSIWNCMITCLLFTCWLPVVDNWVRGTVSSKKDKCRNWLYDIHIRSVRNARTFVMFWHNRRSALQTVVMAPPGISRRQTADQTVVDGVHSPYRVDRGSCRY